MPSVLDRPPNAPSVEPDRDQDEPRTQSRAQRLTPRGGFRFPWARGGTRVAAAPDDDELLIINRTAEAWVVGLGYRSLGTIEPREQLRVQVVRTGMLTARQSTATTHTGYLTARISANTNLVTIRSAKVQGEVVYDVVLSEGKHRKRKGSRA